MPDDATAALYDRSDIGSSIGFGTDPAVVVADVQVGVTHPDQPAGFDQAGEIAATNQLIDLAREAGVVTNTAPDA
jgi:hypothetical protein